MDGGKHVWACAVHMLKMHGVDAEFHAAQRADMLLDEGDLDGRLVWLAILRCIEAARNMAGPKTIN